MTPPKSNYLSKIPPFTTLEAWTLTYRFLWVINIYPIIPHYYIIVINFTKPKARLNSFSKVTCIVFGG